jgi:hypothetical protein
MARSLYFRFFWAAELDHLESKSVSGHLEWARSFVCASLVLVLFPFSLVRNLEKEIERR